MLTEKVKAKVTWPQKRNRFLKTRRDQAFPVLSEADIGASETLSGTARHYEAMLQSRALVKPRKG